MRERAERIAAGNLTGAVQAFRRQYCEKSSLTCTLQRLISGVVYEVSNADSGDVTRITTDNTGKAEVSIALNDTPAAAILTCLQQLTTKQTYRECNDIMRYCPPAHC